MRDKRKKQEKRKRKGRDLYRKRLEAARRVAQVYEIVLSAFGLWGGFCRLPQQDQRTLLTTEFARMKVVLAPSAQGSSRASDAREELMGRLRAREDLPVRTDEGSTNARLSLEEYVGVFPAIINIFEALRGWNAAHNESSDRADILGYYDQALRAIVSQIGDNDLALRGRLFEVLDRAVIPQTDLGGDRLVWYEHALLESPRGIPYHQYTIHDAELDTQAVEIDGRLRPIARFGCAIGPGLRLPSWSGEMIGREAHRRYPVYSQAHAVENFRRRVPLESYERELRYSLLDSLEQPKLVPGSGGEFLVEFRFVGYRLGYFVATPLGDRVVLRTFLLLTMQGTPEAEEFRRVLKARRADIEYLGLDRLETFLTGDIQLDPTLVRILDECGCGPLLALRNPDSLADAVRGTAELIRKYCRIDESPRLLRS